MTRRDIIFVGNARDYHAMDWYRSAQVVCAPRQLAFATDLVESEGHVRLVRQDDDILPLVNVDAFLLHGQSRFGNLWRNAVKFGFLPLQVRRLRRLHRQEPQATFHAHTMYYMIACWLAGVPFVGTPQGSEVLVRPHRARLYRWFATHALRAARAVTVDSEAMRAGVQRLAGRDALVVQNGIDVVAVRSDAAGPGVPRAGILSMRGLTPLYRITELVRARNATPGAPAITFVYPFWEEGTRTEVHSGMRDGDQDFGRLPKDRLYAAMRRAALVVSIPRSDSSPRSVYEAIFSGAAVAIVRHPYVDALPADMRARLIEVDVGQADWLARALDRAREITARPYEPSDEALEAYDQRRSMQRLARMCYGADAPQR